MTLDIAICTHNRPDDLSCTLDSLAGLHSPEGVRLRLVLVLNACDLEVVTWGRRCAAVLPFASHVVEEPEPGLSHARNRAIRESTADWLAFLDDDVKVSPEWAQGLLATAAALEADIIAGRTQLWWRDCAQPDWWSPHFDWIVSAFDHGDVDHILTPARAVGANFACARRVYEAVGLFDPDLGRKGCSLAAGEESDYLARADARGFCCAYSAGAKVQHLVAPKRLEPAYFRQVSHYQGRAHYHASPRLGAARLKSTAYQLAMLGSATLKQLIAPKDSAEARYALVKRANALGALNTLLADPPDRDRPFAT
ncbi:glycosyltransferase family 2 protein [Sagittula stellata]|uniref:glycosyltransferase family 2 protein n=1 Tax=Sagittula stellata TaxID=52603 RepID=UPI00321B5445